jgi:hypothetical protein
MTQYFRYEITLIFRYEILGLCNYIAHMFGAASDRESSTVPSSNIYLFIRRPYEDEGNAGNTLLNLLLFSKNNVARLHHIFILSYPKVQGEMASDFGGMTLSPHCKNQMRF